jgi:ABC-type Fe3+-hydroxamate transport system substrate-binding protein
MLIWAGMTLTPAYASISVVDDAGNTVTLQQPAKRIITLAPHLTEIVYAIRLKPNSYRWSATTCISTWSA